MTRPLSRHIESRSGRLTCRFSRASCSLCGQKQNSDRPNCFHMNVGGRHNGNVTVAGEGRGRAVAAEAETGQGPEKPRSVACRTRAKQIGTKPMEFCFAAWRQLRCEADSDTYTHTFSHTQTRTLYDVKHIQSLVTRPSCCCPLLCSFFVRCSRELCVFLLCSRVYMQGAQCVCVFLIASRGIVHTPRVTNQQDMLAGAPCLIAIRDICCVPVDTLFSLSLHSLFLLLSLSLALTLPDKHFDSLRIFLSYCPRIVPVFMHIYRD